MSSARCSVRLCRTEAVGESPVTCLPVCEAHMQDDLTELRDSEARIAQRIQHFKKYQEPLRLMQQRLASDLQLLDDTFADLRETLDRCQADLIAAVTKQHDQLMDSLKNLSELDDFEKELKQAKDENNMRQAFLISRDTERSLRNFKLDSKLVRMDEDEEEVEVAAYPDLNSRVRELKMGVCVELTLLRTVVEQFDNSNPILSDEQQEAKAYKIGKLAGNEKAVCLTVCNNTNGFVIDKSGRVSAAAEDGSGGSQLPQPSIFVAVDTPQCDEDTSEDSSVDSNAETKSNILLMSADAEVVGRLTCSWEADLPIRDLHCDNQRQLLFVAQRHAVTVTDLSGTEKSKIAVEDLLEIGKKIYCIAGNSDKLFVFSRDQESRLILVGICKDSRRVQMEFPLPDSCYMQHTSSYYMAIEDRMLTLSNGYDWATICTITGKLVIARSLGKKDLITASMLENDFDRKLDVLSCRVKHNEFNLFFCISLFPSVLVSRHPHYVLSADEGIMYQLVKAHKGRVIFETLRLEYLVEQIEESNFFLSGSDSDYSFAVSENDSDGIKQCTTPKVFPPEPSEMSRQRAVPVSKTSTPTSYTRRGAHRKH